MTNDHRRTEHGTVIREDTVPKNIAKRQRSGKTVATPYDDAFRSLVEKCHKSTIFLINEMFRETGYLKEEYNGQEEYELLANESFGPLKENSAEKRITDSRIRIYGKTRPREFHLECQSVMDHEILIRIFEYDMRMARDSGILSGDRLIVEMPCSAVLYLRSTDDMSDAMWIEIHTPNGQIKYAVPVLQIRNYGVDAIIKRKLYFLIPFYSFTVANHFRKMDTDRELIAKHLADLERLLDSLQNAAENGELSSYEATELSDALQYVEHFLIPERYDNLKKEVKKYMGGKVLEFRADRILKQGIKQGIDQGIKQGRLETAHSMFVAGVPFETVRKFIDAEITDEELHALESGDYDIPLQG